MYILTIPQHFANLRNISQTVENYLSQELYISDFGKDEYNERDILAQCYTIIEDDLSQYGVSVDLQFHGDFYRSGYVYLLLELVKKLPELITLENQDIVSAALDESDNSLQDIYEALKLKAPYNELEYIIYQVYSDQKFDEYIKSILNSLEDDSAIYNPDVDREVKYIEKIRELRAYATKYTNIILANYGCTYDRSVIDKLLKEYDLDKINPSAIKIYSLIDNGEVPEYLKSYKDEQMLIHHERTKHHIEYWIDPKKSPRPLLTFENIVLLVAHHAEPGTTKDEYSNEIEEMINMGRTILTQDQIDLIKKLSAIVLENME